MFGLRFCIIVIMKLERWERKINMGMFVVKWLIKFVFGPIYVVIYSYFCDALLKQIILLFIDCATFHAEIDSFCSNHGQLYPLYCG